MKKIIFLTYLCLITIMALGTSIELDEYYKRVDLIESKSIQIPFYITNNEGYDQIINIKSASLNDIFFIEYPQEIRLKPYETKMVVFDIISLRQTSGTYFLFFQLEITKPFNEIFNKMKVSIPFLIEINLLEKNFHPVIKFNSYDFGILSDREKGLIFPSEILNKSNMKLDFWGSFRVFTKDNLLVSEKVLTKENAISVLPYSNRKFDIFVEKYLIPDKYQFRVEIYYGYKSFFQERYIFEKEFYVTENLYDSWRSFNLLSDIKYIYLKIPKVMSPREYITFPQEISFNISNNDFVTLVVDPTLIYANIPLDRIVKEKYLKLSPEKFELKAYDKKKVNLIADYRRADLSNLKGEYFGILSAKAENLMMDSIRIPIILDFGDNDYKISQIVSSSNKSKIDDFTNLVELNAKIENNGNSSAFYLITVKKWIDKIGRQVGDNIYFNSNVPLLPGESITINEEFEVEMGIDKLIIDVEYYKGPNREILSKETYILEL